MPSSVGLTSFRRALFVAVAVVMLSACRLDVGVGVTVDADGSGEVVVAATVDKDVVDQTPGLRGSLILDDATAAGWVVEGPAQTEVGGLTVTLQHRFATVQEAANLLNSLGPPFTTVALERTATEDEVVVALTGSLTLAGGTWDAFGDSALLQTAGGTPFGAQLNASGATPASAMTVELTMQLPGQIETTTGDRGDAGVTWSAPLDGSTEDLSTRAVLRAGDSGGSGWAGPVSTIALVLLIAWVVAGAALAVLVVRARSRRRNRPIRRLY